MSTPGPMLELERVETYRGPAQILRSVSLTLSAGESVCLVGRNGAGKTTTLKVLAGEGIPYAGQVERTSEVGYLPQDPRTGDLDVLARDRILSARGLDEVVRGLREAEGMMASADAETHERGMRRYARLDAEFTAKGGYAAEAEAERICSNLGLPERVLDQPLRTLSGGQRRRV